MPFDLKAVTSFAKEHPVELGVGVAVVGLGALYVLGFFSSSSSPGGVDPNLASAFYGAQAQEAASGNALQMTEINAKTAEAIAQIEGGVSTTNATTWANTDLAMTVSNNQTAMAAAPYAVESDAISAYAAIASLPPTTTTTTKKSSGFLGLGALFGGGSKSTVTKQTPNPAAVNAAQNLSTLINGLYVAH